MTADRAHQLARAFHDRVHTLDRDAWITTVAELLRTEFAEVEASVRREYRADD
jgi:hypothetical protein